MIAESRPWIDGGWKFALAVPAAMALAGLWAISDNPHELRAGAPMLLLLAYALIAGMLGRTRVEVTEHGFRLTPGPLPAFVRSEQQPREAITQLFPRHIREAVAKNVYEDRYYAAVELAGGRWVNVRGHYRDWAGASQASLEIARLWRLPEIGAGRSGHAAKRDWTAARTVLLWGGAFLAAMLWGLYAEVTRGR
ncbi:MAG: hypothetical protein IT162_14845 [Bryobacterales bacterium]|nr:hypothetical protein [Bryobacterales bacterium]